MPLSNKKEVDKAYREKVIFSGLVIKADDRGLILDISGTECYMPIAEIDKKYVHPSKLKGYLGEMLKARIIQFNRRGKCIKVSQRIIEEGNKN